MPSPPRKNEKKQAFISRAIAFLRKEGKTQSQAAGQAYSMWRQSKKKGGK